MKQDDQAGRFTPANAKEMARRSAEARRQNRERKAVHTAEVIELRWRELADLPDRSEIGDLAGKVVVKVLVDVLDGTIPIRSASEGVKFVDAAYSVLRLEAGHATTATASMSRDELIQMVSAFSTSARERLGGAADQ